MSRLDRWNVHYPDGKKEEAESLKGSMSLGRFGGANVETAEPGDCPDLWKDETELPKFDSAMKNPRTMVWGEMCVDTMDWVLMQYLAARTNTPAHISVENFIANSERRLEGDERAQELLEMVASGESKGTIPAPFLELDKSGKIRGFQEGRTRGVTAWIAGYDMIPVYVFKNLERGDGEYQTKVNLAKMSLEQKMDREFGLLRESYLSSSET